MSAEIRYAPEHGPGHAWLILAEPAAADATITVTNEAETNRHLGPNGWQSVPADLPLGPIEPWKDGSRALLGPAVVDRIADSEWVSVALGGREVFSDFWPSIPRAGRRGAANGILAPAAAPPRAPEPLPLTPAPREPAVSRVEPAVVEPSLAAPELDASAAPSPAGRRLSRGMLAAAAALLLLLAAGAAAYHWRDRLGAEWATATASLGDLGSLASPGEFDPIGAARSALGDWLPGGEAAPPAPAPVAAAPAAPAAAATAAAGEGDFALGTEGWQRLVADPGTDPARLFALGRALRERQGGDPNLGFQAIYAAVQRGDREALGWYARANDPTLDHAPAEAVEAPNVRRALEAYRAGASGGDAAAAPALARLCDHLRPKRFSGTADERTSFQDFCS